MMNQFGDETRDSIIDLAEKRFEIKLTKDSSGIRGNMAAMESRFDQRLTKEIAGIRDVIHTHNTATIKWMFLFWIGQIGVLLGILLAVFK